MVGPSSEEFKQEQEDLVLNPQDFTEIPHPHPQEMQIMPQEEVRSKEENDENIQNIMANVILPSFIGGLGSVGLTAIGLNAPSRKVQIDQQNPTNTNVGSRDYLPSLNMGAGSEFFIYGCIVTLLATLIGSVGILSLIGVPSKKSRSKTWQIGIVYALLFPTAISALIQNQFLGGQQASVEDFMAEQQKSRKETTSTIEEVKKELRKSQAQLRISSEIIAAPERYAQPQKSVLDSNKETILKLERLQADLEKLND